MSVKGIWITWEKQRRNEGISTALKWKLYEITYNDCRILRYVKSLYKTISILFKESPDIVVAQNPSIFLSASVILLKYAFRYKCLIDAHNAGLFPLDNKIRILNYLSKAIQRISDFTIVSNEGLAEIVRKNKGKAIVVPDKIPDPPRNMLVRDLRGKINFAFICSFSSDEPYEEAIEAARHIPENIVIYITGKYVGRVDPEKMPSNVKLVGFIPDNEYWSLISSVDGIIVLTIRENCLICGAYEAIALKKPMILSNTNAIKNYFSLGTVYTEPNSTDIQKAILTFIDNKDKLSIDVEKLEAKLKSEWEVCFEDLLNAMGAK
jgi:glycosyltransferase involved in cell wall biosynthesis